jgi:hypothetical protein
MQRGHLDDLLAFLAVAREHSQQLYRPTNPAVDWAQHHPFKNRLRELIAGVIALRKTGGQQQ